MEHVLALQFMNETRHHIQNFKALLKNTFDPYCETGLYNLRFYSHGQVIEDLDPLGLLELLSSLAYENSNAQRKQTHR